MAGKVTGAGERLGQGSLATSGNNHALRIDKAFVRQNPELARTGRRVSVGRVAANTFVFRILDDAPVDEAVDPAVAAYLAFLQDDMVANPHRLAPLTERDATRWEGLIRDPRH